MLYEIRWHGRGGQGAITAAQIIAEAAYYHGMYITASPSFGAERRGAPITASTRISDEKIRLRSPIVNPDIVVVLDETLLRDVDVTAGLKKDGILIVNSPKHPKDLKLKRNDIKVATADATKVALDLDLRSAGLLVMNTTILGAVVRATQMGLSLEDVLNTIKKHFSGANGERNAEGAKRTFDITICE
jgi:2-oxoacid:acceptor oxidoreductase gamma subunit (pyruvate/2-ketoisovalerate family)